MKVKLFLLDLLFSIIYSTGSITVAFVIICSVLIIANIININPNDMSLMLSIIIGIISSVVATLLMQFINKFDNSRKTFKEILNQTRILLMDIGETPLEDLYQKKNIFSSKYLDICVLSSSLCYKKEFIKISNSLYELIKIIQRNNEESVIDSYIKSVEKIIDNY